MIRLWPKRQPAAARSTTYVREFEQGVEYLESFDGISWSNAPVPPKKHDCWPQTRGFMLRSHVERCACGAISRGDGYWMERNSATREQAMTAPLPGRPGSSAAGSAPTG